ncbi:MAG: U32 family peptidase [Clostridiales bacterium]|nr:U32 family peptidase [Clostridiales bacterium]
MKKPEILSPAGDFEKLESALYYGADAVYLAGDMFGMRTAAASFGGDSLIKACAMAHERGVKVYLTCNTVPRNDEIPLLPAFFENAAQAGVDAFIITDIGVMKLSQKYAPGVDIHISTQAGITNYQAANAFYDLGAKRVVTARELSLNEIKQIRAKTPKALEIECFVHGAMCVSFSGRCLLSNYLTNRDSNRGDCAQPCRWNYALVEEKREGQYFPVEQDSSGTYILNSRDMCMINHIPALTKAGIDSFKIEGRAKSAYYTGAVTNAYRCAVDSWFASGCPDEYETPRWLGDEMAKISNREYCTGFYFTSPLDDAQIYYKGGYVRQWDVVAVADGVKDGRLFATQRNRFFEGDEVEIMLKGAKPLKMKVNDLRNEENEKIENAPHPMMKLSFECDTDIEPGSYIRIERE